MQGSAKHARLRGVGRARCVVAQGKPRRTQPIGFPEVRRLWEQAQSRCTERRQANESRAKPGRAGRRIEAAGRSEEGRGKEMSTRIFKVWRGDKTDRKSVV